MAEKEDAPDAGDGKKSKKKLLVIALIAVNVLGLGGLGAFVLLGSSSEAAAEAPEQGAEGAKPAEDEDGNAKPGKDKGDAAKADAEAAAAKADADTGDLGPVEMIGKFTINLADRTTSRYLRVVVSAELSSADTVEELKSRNAQLRHLTIAYLSSLKLKETQGAGALEELRGGLEKRFNNVLTTGTVRQVYFTDFVTQ